MTSSAWLHYIKTLQERVLHHLEEEEKEFFKHSGKVLSNKQNNELADDYKK